MPATTARNNEMAQTTPKPHGLVSPGMPPRFIPNRLAIKVGTEITRVNAVKNFMISLTLLEMMVP